MPAIFHITHTDNLPGILGRAALLADTTIRAAGMKPRSIAYGHIKERRNRTVVPLPPGGVVSDYVPFYFCPRSPMLFAIHRGQIEGYPGGQSQVLHLVSDTESLNAMGLPCLHTDGNAASQPLRFFDGTTSIAEVLSWDVINSTNWGNTIEDNDRKRRKQAEFLVWQSVPWRAIHRIGVVDENVGLQVRGLLANAAHRPDIVVCRDWYYS